MRVWNDASVWRWSARWRLCGSVLRRSYSFAFPPALKPLGIDGGLVFDGVVNGSFSVFDDVDEFTVALDAGQFATVLLSPSNASIQSRLELLGPSGVIQSFDRACRRNIEADQRADYRGRQLLRPHNAIGWGGSYSLQLILKAVTRSRLSVVRPTIRRLPRN